MRHDGGVEECGGFECVFTAEKCADEKLTRARDGALREDMGLHFGEMAHEHRLDVQMTGVEVLMHGGEFLLHFFLRQRQGASNDGGKALGAGGNERADDDAGTLRLKSDLMAVNSETGHVRSGSGCCAKVISARARWKARVDSAPWFSLMRSGCRPSAQPPVMGS